MEINAQYFGPKIDGVYSHKSKLGIHIALRKSIIKEKLNFVVGINDIFHTFIGTSQANFQNQNWSARSIADTRRFKIGLTYNFGKIKIQERAVNSNETEKDRLKH